MSGDIDHVVDAAHDPKITVTVFARAVAGKVNTVYLRPVLLPVPFVITINCSKHGRPRACEHEIAALIRADGFAVASHHIRGNAGKWPGSGTGFRRSGAGQGTDHDGAGFGLPPGVHNRATFLSDDAVIPHPGLRIDWLADRAQQTQRRKIMLQW